MAEPDSESKNSSVETPIKSTKLMSWSGVRRIVGNWKFGIATTVVFAGFGVYYEQKDRDTEVMLLGEWRCEYVDDGVMSEGTIKFLRQSDQLVMHSVFRHQGVGDERQLASTQVSVWRVRKGGAELVEEPRSMSVSGSLEAIGQFNAEFNVDSFGSSSPVVRLTAFEADQDAASADEITSFAKVFEESLSESVSDSKYWQSEILRVDQSQLVLEYKDYVTACMR